MEQTRLGGTDVEDPSPNAVDYPRRGIHHLGMSLPGVTVEASRAQRIERQQARYRDRGGYVPVLVFPFHPFSPIP